MVFVVTVEVRVCIAGHEGPVGAPGVLHVRRRMRAARCISFVASLVRCYRYAQLLCLLFFLQIIVYLPGETLATAALRYTSFAVAAGFDNFLVALMFTDRPGLAFAVAIAVVGSYGVFAAVVIPLAPCEWCTYYVSQIPATRMIEFPYIVCGLVYGTFALWSRRRWTIFKCATPRPALWLWASMLSVSYLCGGIGMMILNSTPADAGFCFVDFGVLWYTLACSL